jgi:DNA-binding XRE family transcriptional regulator
VDFVSGMRGSETVNQFGELRKLADESLQVAAAKVGVSSTKLWNFENARANSTLTEDQKTTLCRHYGRLIKKRLERVSQLLVEE